MSESVSPPPKGRSFSFSIRSPRDFWGGLVLIAVAILAIWASRDLPGQRGFAFGPGTAPRLFAGLLVGLGALVALTGLVTDGPRIEKYKVRGPVLVIASILLFAAMIRPLGMVIASYVTFVVAILGSKEMRVVESLLGAAVMTAFCVGLFVYLLNLPFQLWPRF
jgi:putative tricarboxylic transport membrane protein